MSGRRAARTRAGRPSGQRLTAVDTVPSIPDSPRLASTRRSARPVAYRSTSRTTFDEPNTSNDPAGTYRRQHGQAMVPMATSSRRGRRQLQLQHWIHVATAASQPSSAGSCRNCRTLDGSTRRAFNVASIHRGESVTTSTTMPGSPNTRRTARDSVGCPTTTMRSGRCVVIHTASPSSNDDTASADQAPDEGSATTGQCAPAANAAAASPTASSATSPAMTSVRRSAAGSAAFARCPDATDAHGACSRRPASGSTHPRDVDGIRGSRNATLRCTGPGSSDSEPAAAASARLTSARQYATCPGRCSGAPTSRNRRTAVPYSPIWSVAWLAPTPRNSGGRSAVRTRRGTDACDASSTAGCRFAAAVPDVQTTATGRREAFASPRARNAAVRSSMRTCNRSRRAASASYSAYASGALREPGDITASTTPPRTSSSTTTFASACDGFTHGAQSTIANDGSLRSSARTTSSLCGVRLDSTHGQESVDRQQ